MSFFTNFYQSSIGKKWIVALTGLILLGFVAGHLIGNLQIFLPPVWINSYARHLENLGPLLWAIRLVLLVMIVLHIVTTIKLSIENRQARPERYAVKKNHASTTASRTMIWSGVIVLVFVIFHILHYTVRLRHPEWGMETFQLEHGERVRDVYNMMVEGFKNFAVSAFYILGVFLLCLHLSHGISSMLQTLGLNDNKLQATLTTLGKTFAWLIFAGYVSIPISIMLGIVTLHH